MKRVELADKSPLNSSQQPRINRLTLIIAALSSSLSLGYLSWRQIQLNLAQESRINL